MTVDSLNVNFQFEVALTTAVKIKQIIFRMKVPGKHHFSIKSVNINRFLFPRVIFCRQTNKFH